MNGGRLRTLIIKELLSYLRDPRARLILVGPPLIQLLIFSFAATLEVRNVDIAVLDADGGPAAADVIDSVAAAGFVDELYRVERFEDLQALIDRRAVLLALRFGPGFSREFVAGNRPVMQVLLDGRRANAAQIALGYVNEVVARTTIDGASAAPESALAVRHWFNPNLVYRWYIVPSLSGVLAMVISLVVPALSIARERELGTFDQLLVSPFTPAEIIIGKTAPALLTGSVIAGIMIAAAIVGFRVPFTGSLVLLTAALLIFIASVVGIGLAVSAVCETQQQAILGAFMVAVPAVLISGFATPVENMPAWLQLIAEANPLRHYLVIVQGSFLKGLPAGLVWGSTLPMLLIALVTLSAATLFVRGRLQ